MNRRRFLAVAMCACLLSLACRQSASSVQAEEEATAKGPQVRRLKYIKVDYASRVIRLTWGTDISIEVDEPANAVTVSTVPAIMSKIDRLLRVLDSSKQVSEKPAPVITLVNARAREAERILRDVYAGVAENRFGVDYPSNCVFVSPPRIARHDIWSVIRAIDAPGKRADKKIQVFHVKHERAGEVAAVLHGVYNQPNSPLAIGVDDERNILVVNCQAPALVDIGKLINALDAATVEPPPAAAKKAIKPDLPADTKWPRVLERLVDMTELPVISKVMPKGTCPIAVTAATSAAEIVDAFNEAQLKSGLVLIRRRTAFTVHAIQK
jgi:hypothetical protein